MKMLLSTKEVASFLGINEKMVYSLISEKGLPASKITGKWLFPRHLVEQWIENNTVNFPTPANPLPPYSGLLVIAGSNDHLLDQAITLFNTIHTDQATVFGNMGSMGGLRALRQNLCHMASSHLLQDDLEEYNFEFAGREMENMPVTVNFCRREQGIALAKGNPAGIRDISDLAQRGIRIVNRPLGTGTRLLFDMLLNEAGMSGEKIDGYNKEMGKHLDAGIEVLSGRADAAPCIRPVASLLGLDFIPLRWERFDLLITKERFFDKGIQNFIGMLHEKAFRQMAAKMNGYDISLSGRMIFPTEADQEGTGQ